MKKNTLLILAAATATVCSAQSKFDAGGIMVMDAYRQLQLDPMTSTAVYENLPVALDAVKGRSDAKVSAFITLNPGASVSDLEVRGIEVLAEVGDMVIAQGTLADIEAISKKDFVRHISFGEKRTEQLNRARTATGVEAIHAGTGLEQAYKGSGVITGIYDSGLDPNHVNFLDDDFNSRMGVMWNFTGSNGSCITYTPDRISSFKTDNNSGTHGTHTLGCMAGSYNGKATKVAIIDDDNNKVTVSSAFNRNISNPYYGMAPEATIAAGCGELYDANIAMAVKNVYEFAKAQGKPVVMNLSMGSVIGPHDGTDGVCQVLSSYGKDMPIFISSSNNGDSDMSIDKTFSAGDTKFATLCSAPSRFSGVIDIWSATDQTFTFVPLVYDLNTQTVLFEYPIDGSKEGTTVIANSNVAAGNNKVTSPAFDKAFTSSSVNIAVSKNTGGNNRYNVRVNTNIVYSSQNSDMKLVFGFRIEGSAGQRVMAATNADSKVNGYEYPVEFSSMDQPGFESGSADFSINSMACGDNLIVVGAWTTRNNWPTLSGFKSSYNGECPVGEAADFSSYGTRLDGVTLPTVCAPGQAIISSISTPYMDKLSTQLGADFETYVKNVCSADQNVNGRRNFYDAEQGTSMSSPVCAGGVALWLQADPTLTFDDVKSIIEETADKDEFVTNGIYPAAKWGAGKFNAMAGLRKVLGLPTGGVNAALPDDMRLIITSDNNGIEAFVAGENGLVATLHNMGGMLSASAKASGDTVNVSTADLAPGVYVLTVQGEGTSYTRKVVVK